MSLFDGVVQRNDEIEDGGKRVENLIRGILAGNIFDLGSAQVCIINCMIFFLAFTCYDLLLVVSCHYRYVDAQATLRHM